MPIPQTHFQEELSNAYITAVVAKAGALLKKGTRDYGIDYEIREVIHGDNGVFNEGPSLFTIQLKATHTTRIINNHVKYTISAQAYNKIADFNARAALTNQYLVVLHLPENPNEWLSLTEEQLLLKNCCYYYKITEPTENQGTKVIEIPRENISTLKQLKCY